jgi:hypothetical protein
MCCDDEKLMAYLDGELGTEEVAQVEMHLVDCAACRQRLEDLRRELGLVTNLLNDYRRAAYRLQPSGLSPEFEGRIERKEKMQRWKKGLLTATAAAAFLVMTIFTPLGAMAADLLNVFRVEKFVAVRISQSEMEEIRQALEQGEGSVNLEDIGTIEMTGTPREERVSLEVATAEANWPFRRLPEAVEDFQLAGVSRTPASGLTFKLDVVKANALISRFGGSSFFPEDLDQRPFSFTMPTQVCIEYTGAAGQRLMLSQGRSPEVSLPEGAEVAQIRDVVLGLPFIPESLRSRLAAVGDWRNTAILPAVDGQSREIRVRGQAALLFTLPATQVAGSEMQVNGDGSFTIRGGETTWQNFIIWQEDGVIFTLLGNLDEATLVAIAERLE